MKIAAGILLVVLVLIGFNSFYVVHEGQGALVLQFGRVLRFDDHPGLHAKLPLLQQVTYLDERLLDLEAQPARYFTAGNQGVDANFYVKWRIADAAAYYRATGGSAPQAVQRLTPLAQDALRRAIHACTLQQLLGEGRQAAVAQALATVDAAARQQLGIAVVDLRIERIELPDEASAAVYKRMRAERQQLAAELRSSGQQEAATIKADANEQAQVILADAGRDAARIRGQGEAQAAAIYAHAYGQDPEFFAFYGSLQAYRKAFANGRGVLILEPDSPFLRYFDNPTPAQH